MGARNVVLLRGRERDEVRGGAGGLTIRFGRAAGGEMVISRYGVEDGSEAMRRPVMAVEGPWRPGVWWDS